MSVTKINGGTQVQANTITNGQVNSTIIIAAGTNAFTGDQSLGGFKVTNVGAPVSGGDAANKTYVDAAIQGLTIKPTARVATTAALATCTYANGTSGVGATLTGNAAEQSLLEEKRRALLGAADR